MKKIMITGGAGFIGSHLGKKLHKEGHDIIIVDDFSTGQEKNIDYAVPVYNLDLSKQSSMSIMDKLLINIDVVYHLASSIGVELINEKPNETLHNSFDINNNLFPLFEKHNVKVIFSSTSEVYGETCESGAKESDVLKIMNSSRGSYSCAKLLSEFLIKSYNFPYVIVRLFNVVGPKQTGEYGHVIPRFIQFAKNNEELTLYNGGEQSRSFCDIRDGVEMLSLLLNDKHNGEIYNIGNSENIITMRKLANTIIDMLDSKSKIKNFEKDNQDIQFRNLNSTKMDKYYKPKYNINDIIFYII